MNLSNGLNDKEIKCLYLLLHNYEKLIKKLTTDENLYNEYGHLRNFFKSFPKKITVKIYKANIAPKSKDFFNKGENKDDFCMIKSKKTKIQSLIYHLRNAFAHNLIEIDDNYVTIKDYNVRKHYYSAYGYIRRNDFDVMLSLLTNNKN